MIYSKLFLGISMLSLSVVSVAEEVQMDNDLRHNIEIALEKRISLLENKVSQMQTEIEMQSQVIQSLKPLIAIRQEAPQDAEKDRINEVPQDLPSDDKSYNAILPANLTHFNEQIAKKKYNKAIIDLEKFIIKSSDDNDRGAAYYLIAEAYSLQGNKKQAAENYLRSYKRYPNNIMAPDSLLKLSIYLADKNEISNACDLLRRLEIEYPRRTISNKEIGLSISEKLECNK